MTLYSCLVESDLLDCKHKRTVRAKTLKEFIEIIWSEMFCVPQAQLLFEVYDTEFEEFVGKKDL